MKIGILTHYYDPEGGAAATPGVIARALKERGHHVEVLTGFPNYPSGHIADGYALSKYQREELDGITVHRVPIYPSHDDSAVRRIANYMSFGLSSIVASAKLLRAMDVQLVYFSPATTAVGALGLRLTKRTPTAFLIQDMWPESVTSSGFLSPRVAKVAEGILIPSINLLYKSAAAVAVTSPGMADILKRRGVPPNKIDWIPNWSDEAAFYPAQRSDALRAELGLDRDFTIMYAGNFGDLQNLDNVIEAADRLRNSRHIQFALVGAGVRENSLRDSVEKLKLDNVTFIPSQPFSRMAEVIAQADCQLITLQDLPILQSTLPSKVQANLASGTPIIGSVAGDAATVLRESGAGPVVNPADPDQLAAAVESMAALSRAELNEHGCAARRYYLNRFSKDTGALALESLLESIKIEPS